MDDDDGKPGVGKGTGAILLNKSCKDIFWKLWPVGGAGVGSRGEDVPCGPVLEFWGVAAKGFEVESDDDEGEVAEFNIAKRRFGVEAMLTTGVYGRNEERESDDLRGCQLVDRLIDGDTHSYFGGSVF